MCGIIGYVGNKKASNILIDGLLALEYRGYDSAGIATLENNEIKIMKDKGRVKNILDLDGYDKLEGTYGIAHTRWATHGKPSKENSHPHFDNSNTFAVVHNGIIENYNELRSFLTEKGYTFYSQTDTEVIPNLIHYYFTNLKDSTKSNTDKILEAVASATKDLKGSYAIEVISPLMPDTIIVGRKDSPLVIGTKSDEKYIASDIPALLTYTKDFYLLDDNELAVITKDSISFYNNNLETYEKEIKNIEWDASAAEKNGYEDYMLKEIFEQPNSIRETVGSRLKLNEPTNFDDLDIKPEYLKNVNKIFIVACGTAMHAGLVGKVLLEKLCKIPTEVDIASEFRYRDPIIDDKTLCIYVSQSGETADTIAALKLSKAKGAKTLAISNVIGSSITREADYTIYTHAGPEIAVASTKAYTSQVVLFAVLAIHFAELLGYSNSDITINADGDTIKLKDLKQDIIDLPKKLSIILENTDIIKEFADEAYNEKDMFFLGRGIDETVAKEGSLKLKEISYIHSEAYAAGELKHGPIALIENGIHVISILTDSSLAKKSISNIQEVITRGAKTMVVTNQDLENHNFDYVIKIPQICPLISPILSVVPLQLLSYYISKNKGLDVDKPRNLAKSVTVE
ncbi:MAG: glutamine--fructose-6-phosphate transaminase (isomerizing) [Clostridia bacterium]|nr:glutamine--fructose-6-phosphate transaminase (isomerizing) [Clostridia bacterium]